MLSRSKLLAGAAIIFPLALGACGSDSNTMRIATHSQLENLDPEWTTAYITRNHGYLVYDTLFALDQNFEPQPQMVESFTKSGDQRTWTFRLRPGLKWHDGTNVTAADCVASLERWGKRDGTGQELFRNVTSVSAADDRTIVLQLNQPSGQVPEALAKVSANVPFMMPKRLADTDPNTPITEAVGSGPYMFDKSKWAPGAKAVYVKNPNYVPRAEKPSMAAGGKQAKAGKIELAYYGNQQEAVDALVTGKVDYVESPSTKLLPDLIGKDHVVVANTDPLGNVAMMRFNAQQKPFDNPAVRRAVLMTIKQDEYMTAALGDRRFWRQCYSVYACGTPMANESGSTILQTANLEAAQKALKAARYDGTPVVVLNPRDNPVISALTAVTVENLRKIGMTVEVRDMTLAEMMRERTGSGWNLFHTWWLGGDVVDPMGIAYSGDAGKGWPGAPSDAQLERYRLAFAKATTAEERKAIAAKTQDRVLAIGALGTLGQFIEPVAFRDNITGITSPIQFYWNLARETPEKQRIEGVPGEIKGQFFDEYVGY